MSAIAVAFACFTAIMFLNPPARAGAISICSEEDHALYQYYTTQIELSKVPKLQRNGTHVQITVTVGHCPRACSTSRQTMEAPVEELLSLPLNSKTGSIGDIFAASVPISIRVSEVISDRDDIGDEDIGSDLLLWELNAPYLESIGDHMTMSFEFGGQNSSSGVPCRASPSEGVFFCSSGFEGNATLLVERVAILGESPWSVDRDQNSSTTAANASSVKGNSSAQAAAAASGNATWHTNMSEVAWYWYEAAVALDHDMEATTIIPNQEETETIRVNLLLNGHLIASTSGDSTGGEAFAAGTAQRGRLHNTANTHETLTLRVHAQGQEGKNLTVFLEKTIPVPVLSELCDIEAIGFPFDTKAADAACKSNSSCTGHKGTAVLQVMRIVPPDVLPPELPHVSPSPSLPLGPLPLPPTAAAVGTQWSALTAAVVSVAGVVLLAFLEI
jgi:hypothetical protein